MGTESSIGLHGLGELLRRRARRLEGRLGLWLLSAGAASAALFFFCASLYLFAARTAAPWQAAAITGLAATAVAVALALARRLSRRRRASAEKRSAGTEDMSRMAEAVLEELLRGDKLRTTDLVMMSLVAGVVLGAGPGLRREIAGLRRRRRGREASDD